MSERLSDTYVAEWARYPYSGTTLLHDRHELAREVQASRKLIADLLALHPRTEHMTEPLVFCSTCLEQYPCRSVRLIQEVREARRDAVKAYEDLQVKMRMVLG